MSFQRCGNYFWQKIDRNQNPKTKKKKKLNLKKYKPIMYFFNDKRSVAKSRMDKK